MSFGDAVAESRLILAGAAFVHPVCRKTASPHPIRRPHANVTLTAILNSRL